MINTTAAPDVSGSGAGDIARAETHIPIGEMALFEFISDIERLFRLNPHLEIEVWQETPTGFHMAALNETNEQRIETTARIDVSRETRSIFIHYEGGLKRTTQMAVEQDPATGTARLTVADHYPVIEDAQDPRIAEVDRSLIPWVTTIRRHLLHRARWGRLPGWRWWNERFMTRLPPRQRRIVRLLIWTSVAEFAIFLVLVAILFVSL